jgi:hypothetical protein
MVYLRKNKYALVADVISDNQLSEKEKALRIMAMDAECKNETICDYSMESDSAVEQILGLIKTTEASCA